MVQLILGFALLVLGGPQSQTPPPAPPAPAAPAQPRPNPCDAPEFRHFDFWLGEWEVKGPAGTVIGANTISRIANNCGIHENWRGAGGALGQSVNTYEPSDAKWHQAWVGMGGGLLHLSGGLDAGKMVLKGTTVDAAKAVTMHRVTWTPLPDGRVRQFWESSTDQGKTWTVAFDGHYEKKR